MTGFRSSLAVALLVLAVALLPFATAFWTALPAPGWLAAVAAAGAALALRHGGPPSARRDAPIAAAFGVAAS
ncbi:MAG TPA: hypothetical protein VI942_14225, partial [Thermoanaerobaculia bacterium]|nr:hypothetical protein [Thermoanaerobaculia bacterium]